MNTILIKELNPECFEAIENERIRTGMGASKLVEFAELPESLNLKRLLNIMHGQIKSITQAEYDFIIDRYSIFPTEDRVKLTPQKINKIKNLIEKKNIPKAEISKSFSRYEKFNTGVLWRWLNGDVKSAKASHYEGVMQFIDNYEPLKTISIYETPKPLKEGFVYITEDIQNTIKAEIERTGIGPQRALKGNKEAKKIGLTSGTIYRIIGKNGIAQTARKDHVQLALRLWEKLLDKI